MKIKDSDKYKSSDNLSSLMEAAGTPVTSIAILADLENFQLILLFVLMAVRHHLEPPAPYR